MRLGCRYRRFKLPDAKVVFEYLPIALPLITIVTAIPLVLRKVPPNLFYGFRTPKTLATRDIWYRANYLGGVNLLVASILCLFVNPMISMSLEHSVAILVKLGVIVVAMSVAMTVSLLQVKNL
jgi:uncharacterized membrane protein